MVYTANRVIICYLPPIEGTRKLHWLCIYIYLLWTSACIYLPLRIRTPRDRIGCFRFKSHPKTIGFETRCRSRTPIGHTWNLMILRISIYEYIFIWIYDAKECVPGSSLSSGGDTYRCLACQPKKTLALSDNTNFGRSRLSSLKLTYPLKIGLPKRKVVCQPPIFRGYVSFTEDSFEEIIFWHFLATWAKAELLLWTSLK